MKTTTPSSLTCLLLILLFSLLFLITPPINAVRLHKVLTFSLFFFFFFLSSWNSACCSSRPWQKQSVVDRKRVAARAMIGSSPPRCINHNKRCSSCRHCEAVQVPVLPENKNGVDRYLFPKRINYRGESGDDGYDSNYKPMGWMCKCGDLLFIP